MKRIILSFMLVFLAMGAMAQTVQYNAVAKAAADMQSGTAHYGKVTKVNVLITRSGNSSIKIGDTTYSVLTRDEVVDTDTLKSWQYTVGDTSGKEYVIKFIHNPAEKTQLMRFQIIIFNTAHPYYWTYYFCEEPKNM